MARACLVKPVDLALAQQENSAQHQTGHALWMFDCIRQRQRRSPRAAEHDPLVDPILFAHAFDVRHQIPRRVLAQLRVRRRTPAAALIHRQHAEALWIEEPAHFRREPAAGAAMQRHRRAPVRIAGLLHVDCVQVRNLQHLGRVRFDRGIELAAGRGRLSVHQLWLRIPRGASKTRRSAPPRALCGDVSGAAARGYWAMAGLSAAGGLRPLAAAPR